MLNQFSIILIQMNGRFMEKSSGLLVSFYEILTFTQISELKWDYD